MRDILGHLPHPGDVFVALSLLTRIPMAINHTRIEGRLCGAIWAYPLVGALIGALGGGVLTLLAPTGLPIGVIAALALMGMIALTGAMHEDGLADSFDGLWGGHDKERRLEIMKDSRIGVYGLLALILVILAQWSALSALPAGNRVLILMAVGAGARLPMVLAMYWLAPARHDGLSAHIGRPNTSTVIWAILCTLILMAAGLGWAKGMGVMVFALLGALPMGLIARAKIGGQTGDILGAIAKCAELGALFGIFLCA